MPDIQERGTYIVFGMMSADEDSAKSLVESELFEILLAVSRIYDPARVKAKQYAQQALEKAQDWGLIKANEEIPKK
jgi:hypothetical protein